MDKKSYHHGDLRRELMEKGLELISRYGEDKLSLRKLASECGVTNAAPYAHFRNKAELIAEIQNYVMNLFTEELEKAIAENRNSDKLFIMLGKAYVMFFYKNPLYFDFLFSRKNIKIQLSIGESGMNAPFEVLKQIAMKYFCEFGMSEFEIENKVMAMWSLVHGLSSILVMPNFDGGNDFEARIEDIISSVKISDMR